MKVLILSCTMGEGHNSAGKAVYNKMLQRGIQCEFLDVLSFASDNISQIVNKTYVTITRKSPHLFGSIYQLGTFVSNHFDKSPVYAANTLYADNLYKYIKENNYDVALTPHLFPAEALTYIKYKYELNILTIAIATDYTSIPFWEETNLDYYVIPHKNLMNEFVMKGLPKEKLLPLGIPVDDSFSNKISKKAARIKLDLPLDKPIYLIMTGSMGYGNVQKLLDTLMRTYKEKIEVILITGNNTSLECDLKNRYIKNSNITILGFTSQVAVYMDACNVLFTKPGGLTSTEACVKNVPLIHTNPIPGCETKNARFFAEHGLSYYGKTPFEQIKFASLLMKDKSVRTSILMAQQNEIKKDSSEKIIDFVLEELSLKE